MTEPKRRVSGPLLATLSLAVLATGAFGVDSDTPIDYSSVGYRGGITPPVIPAMEWLLPSGGDDTVAIQAALDRVGTRDPDARGFRGAVLLGAGTFRVSGQILLRASGLVLRGQDATILATGVDRRAILVLEGSGIPSEEAPLAVAADVPVGAVTLPLVSAEGLAVGSRVLVRRPSTRAWLRSIGMDALQGAFHEVRLDWTEGSRDLAWDRRVVALDLTTRTITIDAPITMALESRFGGGAVSAYRWPGRLRRVGVENLTLDSTFEPDNPADEEHAWFGISLDRVEDAFVRNVTVRHVASSAVLVGRNARAISVLDSRSEAPVAEKGNWRRMAFFSSGELVLFRNCRADGAWNPFGVGHAVAGPTVFLDCTASGSLSAGGPAESWATGILYDRVLLENSPLRLTRLPLSGWAAAHAVAWNCEASEILVESPPGAPNIAVRDASTTSLYEAQTLRRKPYSLPLDPSTGPASPAPAPSNSVEALRIAEGRLFVGERSVPTKSARTGWWKGQMVPKRAAELGSSPTRFAPGKSGVGLTEDLEALVQRWRSDGVGLVEAIPGLWYDRRRDDHTTEARTDAAVGAPFFEMAWARSGKGTATDGLSRYDLTRFNPWYFSRLKTVAGLCAREGLVLLHHFYNHHNLVESSAHWADFPWRPANALQDTGLPEPPPYEEEGRRVRLATAFYDLVHPTRRALHEGFIRHGLSVFADEPNVIHVLAFQDAAPLEFQRFFLDTVAAWQRETGHEARIALMTGKNVTDAILADPVRSAQVDVIDTRYWQYMADGSLFAPPAGGNRAYREFRTEAFGKDAVPASTPEQVLRQIREYTERFPSKVVWCPQAHDLGFKY